MNKLIACFLFILVGCTVTKRLHQPGYHIEWKKNVSIILNDNNSQSLLPSSLESTNTTNLTAKGRDSFSLNQDSIILTASCQQMISLPKPVQKTKQISSKERLKKVPATSTNKYKYKQLGFFHPSAARSDLLAKNGLILLICGLVAIGIATLFIVVIAFDFLVFIGFFIFLLGGVMIALVGLFMLLFSLLVYLTIG